MCAAERICYNGFTNNCYELELAPMEGITYGPMRRALAAVFPGADRYYTPFIAANSTHSFKTREKREIDPGGNRGLSVIPQILTNDADAFIWRSEERRVRRGQF